MSPLLPNCLAEASARFGSRVRIRDISDLGLVSGDELTFESEDRLYSAPDGRGRGHEMAREILV
jgi:hypothetical protein